MTTQDSPKSGYDLASKILETHPKDAIETMLKYSGPKAECDWLEFKADITLLPNDREKGETEDQLHWKYIKSLAALANTRGGALIFGVNDVTHEAITVFPDEKKVEEHYRTAILGKLQGIEKKGYSKNNITYSLKRPITPSLDPRYVLYMGKTVLVILIEPCSPGDEFYINNCFFGKHSFSSLPYRLKGCGQVQEFTDHVDIARYIKDREKKLSEPSELSQLWLELDSEAKGKQDDEILDEAIRAYYRGLEKDFLEHQSVFVPLDAEGNELVSEFDNKANLLPDLSAISIFGDDDDLPSNDDDSKEDGIEVDSDEDSTAEDKPSIQMGLTDVLSRYPRVVLTGDPGAGKTTCLGNFVVEQGKAQGDRPHLFAFVPLGLWDYEPSVLGLVGRICKFTLTQIEMLIRERRLHLILDALNECPDDCRKDALSYINNLAKKHPDLPIVLSTRRTEVIDRGCFPVAFEVQAMDRNQQLQLLGGLLRDAKKADSVLSLLEKQPGGLTIAKNPQMLGMVAQVMQCTDTLPSGRAGLYRFWFEDLYKREEKKAKKAKDPFSWTSTQAFQLLAHMSFVARANGHHGEMPLDLARRSLNDSDWSILSRVWQGYLLKIDSKTIHFRHETFQEYLCAEWLLMEPMALDAISEKDYDTWGMPIAYAAELCCPAKLPSELSSAVWKMNPWVAALVSDSISSADGVDPSRPEMALASALLSGENLLSEHLRESFKREFFDGCLFKSKDAPLSYMVNLSESVNKKWLAFECAYALNIPDFLADSDWVFGKNQPQQRFREAQKLRQNRRVKIDNMVLLSRDKMIPVVAGCYPEVSYAEIVRHWCWSFSNGSTSNSRLFGFSNMVNKIPTSGEFPIEAISPLLGKLTHKLGDTRIQVLSKWFGNDFIQHTLNTIPTNPAVWEVPEIYRFLTDAAEIGHSVNEAARIILVRMLDKIESLAVSPNGQVLINVKCLCNLLEEVDVPLVLSNVSDFGRALLKRVGFNPNHRCDPYYKTIQSIIPTCFLDADLNDIAKRKETVRLLLNQDFHMSLSKYDKNKHYAVFRCPIFPKGVVSFNPSIPEENFTIGSEWTVRVGVQTRFRPKNGIMFGFLADEITPFQQDSNEISRGIESSVTFNEGRDQFANQGILSRLLTSVNRLFASSSRQSDLDKNNPCPTEDAKRSFQDEALNSAIDPQQFKGGFAPSRFAANPHDEGPPFSSGTQTTPQYRKADLVDPTRRERIKTELEGVSWDMTVQSLSKDRAYLFFRHPSFPSNVFCATRLTHYRNDFEEGQCWSVQVGINQNKKDGSFGFIARSVRPAKDKTALKARLATASESESDNDGCLLDPIVEKHLPTPRSFVVQRESPSELNIYIDEAWPGAQDKTKRDVGVIAGIAWFGSKPNPAVLPFVDTHLHADGRKQLSKLLQCKNAVPFAFSIRLQAAFHPNPGKYLELLSNAVVLLLGWILPRPSQQTKVCIHAEHFSSFHDGADATDSFKALLSGVAMTQNGNRFSNWSIERVEWQDKNFGYIPYGDLIGYLFAETSEAKRMAKEFNVSRWPGCVPFSPDLLPVLRDLDAKEPTGVAGALFRLAGLCGGSNLFRISLKDTIRRAKQDDALRDAILERICNEFANKERDLRRIAHVADAFFESFPDAEFKERPKLRFLRLLANLQKANHDGHPDAVDAALRPYLDLRSDMEKRDLELCLYGDLNMAVHFNDSFSFIKAEELLRSCRNAPSFPFLSARNRGRLLSSLGQSAALMGRSDDADTLFRRALDAFSETGGELVEEADQTRIYRAFAALDAFDKETPQKIAEALTIPIDEAVLRPEAVSDHPFREHLLAKTLWYAQASDARPDWTQAYLSTSSSWTSAPQHPWELILLYRGLLSWKRAPALAARCFDEWDEWFQTVPHGRTLSLIRGFGLVAMKRHCGRTCDNAELEKLLLSVKNALPDTAPTVNALLRIAQDSTRESIDELWALMPFNYK